MSDELRSPIKHHLVLHKRDPEWRMARFYSLMSERDLFGTVHPVRNGGRIGTNGQELVEIFDSEEVASQALEALAGAKRRRGYGDL
jgi:predicted DNA-binding WGR domain protein